MVRLLHCTILRPRVVPVLSFLSFLSFIAVRVCYSIVYIIIDYAFIHTLVNYCSSYKGRKTAYSYQFNNFE
ncbi:hypothetical protein F5146DRAFT_1067660 [Armillaria mellea]|nr:hypothetical protein F5146DRAFT_1067660 [Armillaria mellea]